jgi:hypothetical protein
MSIADDLGGTAWLHSHEEDTGDEMTYRPASFAFPPSRGRHGFVLQPGGSAVLTGPDPGDRQSQQPATWRVEGGKRLLLQEQGNSPSPLVLEIEREAPDKLLVKRMP